MDPANAHRGACLAQSIAIRYTVTQLRRAFQENVRISNAAALSEFCAGCNIPYGSDLVVLAGNVSR